MEKSAKAEAIARLRGFVSSRRDQVKALQLQGETARILWVSLKPVVEQDLDRLEASVSSLEFRNQDDFDAFDDLLWRAEQTVEWAGESEISRIEALHESNKALFERLTEEEFLSELSAAVVEELKPFAIPKPPVKIESLADILGSLLGGRIVTPPTGGVVYSPPRSPVIPAAPARVGALLFAM